jgi:hypothetical protein
VDACLRGRWRFTTIGDKITWSSGSATVTNGEGSSIWDFRDKGQAVVTYSGHFTGKRISDGASVEQWWTGSDTFNYRITDTKILHLVPTQAAAHMVTKVNGQQVEDSLVSAQEVSVAVECSPGVWLTLTQGNTVVDLVPA